MKREVSKFFSGAFAGFAFTHVGFAIAVATGIFDEPVFLGRTWSAGYGWIEAIIYAAISVALGYAGWRSRSTEPQHVSTPRANV
jgi:hypothetical protein